MRVTLLILLTLMACSDDPREAHIAAAKAFTRHYTQSRLGKWNVRASAAGTGCTVLLVEASIVMDDFMVDALHHGTGAYDVYPGGVEQFARERGFDGVAYKDPRKHLWTYGSAVSHDVATLTPCY